MQNQISFKLKEFTGDLEGISMSISLFSSLPTPATFIHHDLELTFVSETTFCTFDTLFLFILSSVSPLFSIIPLPLHFIFLCELSEKSTADMLLWCFKVKSAQLDIEETDGCKDRVGCSAIITHCPPRTARSEANREKKWVRNR